MQSMSTEAINCGIAVRSDRQAPQSQAQHRSSGGAAGKGMVSGAEDVHGYNPKTALRPGQLLADFILLGDVVDSLCSYAGESLCTACATPICRTITGRCRRQSVTVQW